MRNKSLYGFIFCTIFYSQFVVADFYDPMRPPEFALNKLRLEKMKKTGAAKQLQAGEKKAEPWVLNSILYSKQRKHAIINNKLVREGDVIKGARLVWMNPDSVRLRVKDKTIVLTLGNRSTAIRKFHVKRKL